MPKKLELKLDKLFNQNTTLDAPYENMLDSASDAKNKIGAISNVFDTLSKIELETTPEEEKETREIIKKYIIIIKYAVIFIKRSNKFRRKIK